MARGVSQPRNVIHRAFFDISWMGWTQEVDDNGDLMYDENGEGVLGYDEMIAEMDWRDWLEYSVKDSLQAHYKSLYEVDKWLGREDHAILANNHCYMGVSAYVNVACVWVVNRYDFDNDCYPDFYREKPLAQAWCERIGASFRTVLKPTLNHVGGFSNGEQIYWRAT